MDGWIKLHRKILQSEMYKSLNSKQRDVLTVILLMANHKESKWEYKGEIYSVKPGQFVTSLDGIKANCAKDVSIQNIRTALLKLEKWGFLTNESTKTGRLITIVNWRLYQASDDENQQSDQQTANKQLTPNKNDKNDKKNKGNNRRKRPVYDDDSTYMKMVRYFRAKIQEWKPDVQFKGDEQSWADEFRKIHEIDKRTKEDIKAVIDWATSNPFWQANILSPKKLREKFDTLQAQMGNEKNRQSRRFAVIPGGASEPRGSVTEKRLEHDAAFVDALEKYYGEAEPS